MLNISLNELKLVAESRGIKDYRSMSKERLLSALSKSKLVESKISFDDKKLKKIREDFNKLGDRFLKLKIEEIRKNLYEIKNKKNLSYSKIKEIEENLLELEKIFSRLKKYRDYDDAEYKGIRDIWNLFNQSIDKDYYKPIKTNSAFNGNYIKYESNGDKNKNLSAKEYLNMVRPYLSNIINDHKTLENLKVHSSNEVFDYKTQYGEWKIQLTMSINVILSNGSDETCNMHAKSDNIEIMLGSETDEIIDELFESLLQKYQEWLEESMRRRRSNFIFDSVDLL